MCKAMNRSFVSVILGGFGADNSADDKEKKDQSQLKVVTQRMQLFNEKCLICDYSSNFDMAVAQAQHALREMVDKLKKKYQSYTLFTL